MDSKSEVPLWFQLTVQLFFAVAVFPVTSISLIWGFFTEADFKPKGTVLVLILWWLGFTAVRAFWRDSKST